MKFRIASLKLELVRGREVIPLSDMTYFWGQMGAGKSSIARLIDFCLGGKITLSPALQAEFVSATIELELERGGLSIERPRDSSDVIASWQVQEGEFKSLVPARPKSDADELIPGTGVENLSDLIFWMSGIQPPRVRKSKTRTDSATVRLSIRDLLWYCYLDQDNIDSDFFYLDDNAEIFVKLKSRDVIRYVIGYHDEHIADLEAELDQLRADRNARSSSITSLVRTFTEVGVESEEQMQSRLNELNSDLVQVSEKISRARTRPLDAQTVHAADELRSKSRILGERLLSLEQQQNELLEVRERNTRHRNEIEMLGLKFQRSSVAKEVLGDLHFENCPRCSQRLPYRLPDCCNVCGQADALDLTTSEDELTIYSDVTIRKKELDNVITRINTSLSENVNQKRVMLREKEKLEAHLNKVLQEHDSALLSTILELERERGSLQEARQNTTWLMRLPVMLREHREALAEVIAREQLTREKLKEARDKAEQDKTAIDKFAAYFLDCLVRSGVPGIQRNDRVIFEPPKFYPAIYSQEAEDQTASTFSSLSSGGKKTLFKCCFAIAFHRIATELHAPLPEFLMIDSPMKNISERENREQFEGFYTMLYELKTDELISTQFVLIDKEFFDPPTELSIDISNRHMRPADPNYPPLIGYYRGK